MMELLELAVIRCKWWAYQKYYWEWNNALSQGTTCTKTSCHAVLSA